MDALYLQRSSLMAAISPQPAPPEVPLSLAIWAIGGGVVGVACFFLAPVGWLAVTGLIVGLGALVYAQIQFLEHAASRRIDRAKRSLTRLHGLLLRLGIEAESDREGFDLFLPGPSGGTGVVLVPWGTWGQMLGLPGKRERGLLSELRSALAGGKVLDALIWLPLAVPHPWQRWLPSRFGDIHVLIGDEERVLEALGVSA